MGRYSTRVSHYDYPDDEFDDGKGAGPAPIGVHRAELPAWRSWVSLLAVLILVPILAWGAVKLLGRSSNSSTSTAGTSTATPAGTGAPASEGVGGAWKFDDVVVELRTDGDEVAAAEAFHQLEVGGKTAEIERPAAAQRSAQILEPRGVGFAGDIRRDAAFLGQVLPAERP